jgi:pyridoxamine 5'-phosphate oxidase
MTNSKGTSDLLKKPATGELSESSVLGSPYEQFRLWFDEADETKLPDGNAMTLATAGKDGIPSARTVLLKGFDSTGFVFYTNYDSEKGKEIAENPNVSLLFFWKKVLRQVRITGIAGKVSRDESITYFHSRPVESQLGAWASKQSNIISGRDYFIKEYERLKKEYEGKEIPLPPFWGGYKVVPNEFEFWQGRENRLHDRICYTKSGSEWIVFRRSP